MEQPDRKGMTASEERNLLVTVAMSVIRDRSISSVYGFRAFQLGDIPPLGDFFTEVISEKLAKDFCVYGFDVTKGPLYADLGDLLGQLSRLLMLCQERSSLSRSLPVANALIGKLDFKAGVADGEHIRHLRNAVMHCRVRIEYAKDWEESIVWFEDVNPRTSDRTALMGFNALQLNDLIEILLKEVILKGIH